MKSIGKGQRLTENIYIMRSSNITGYQYVTLSHRPQTFLNYNTKAIIPTTAANPAPPTLRPAPAVTTAPVAEALLVGPILVKLYVFVAEAVTVPLCRGATDGSITTTDPAPTPALFAASGEEAPLLLVGRGSVRVLKTWVVTVVVPLVVVLVLEGAAIAMLPGMIDVVVGAELVAALSGLDETELEPEEPLPLPEVSDELEPESLSLSPLDPDPEVPVSTAGGAVLVELPSAAVTGHTVVVTAMISVVTDPPAPMWTEVLYTVLVVHCSTDELAVVVAAIRVVETGKLVVVTCVPAGQSVTVGAQEVMVCTSVVQIVLVICPASVVAGEASLEEVIEMEAVGPLDRVGLPCWASAEEVHEAGTTVVPIAQLEVE